MTTKPTSATEGKQISSHTAYCLVCNTPLDIVHDYGDSFTGYCEKCRAYVYRKVSWREKKT